MSETVYVVHDYLRRIDKEMTCDKKKKKQFLQRLQNDMEDFADSATTTLTENDLEKHFGTPQSIAENFLSTEPYNEVKRTFKHRKAVRVFVLAFPYARGKPQDAAAGTAEHRRAVLRAGNGLCRSAGRRTAARQSGCICVVRDGWRTDRASQPV